jgi:hypothetical protein
MTFRNPLIFRGFINFFNRLSPFDNRPLDLCDIIIPLLKERQRLVPDLGARAIKKPTAAKTLWARELLPDFESYVIDRGHNAIITLAGLADLELFRIKAGSVR